MSLDDLSAEMENQHKEKLQNEALSNNDRHQVHQADMACSLIFDHWALIALLLIQMI